VHGNNLFKSWLGFEVEARVDRLVRELMTPFDSTTWQSQRNDLPRYAEAAPDTFLDILEQDVASSDPKVYALMQPASAELWSSPSRSGLLWALERLAWNPRWLPRVVLALAKLSELKVNDNWLNKPENSLLSIFRSWMPQTAVGVDERIALLETLKRKQPALAWRIYIDQFSPHSTVGHYSSRPRWRRDAIGAGEVATAGEAHKVQVDAINQTIDWKVHTCGTLSALVDGLEILGPEFQERVWAKIEVWSAANPLEEEKAELREIIRSAVLTRRLRKNSTAAKIRTRARAVLEALTPRDVVLRHLWLLAKSWVQESADELAEENFDVRTREERIGHLRANALKEIWAEVGFQGVVRLCELSEAPYMIGCNLAASVLDDAGVEVFIRQIVERNKAPTAWKMSLCLSGVLHKIDARLRAYILSEAVSLQTSKASYSDDQLAFLLCAAPFHGPTWDLVDTLPSLLKRRYWKEVSPQRLFSDVSAEDVNRVVDELLEVERPRAAFFTIEMDFKLVQSQRLIRLLVECGTVGEEPEGHYQMARHNISAVFAELSKRADVPKDELARLEFLYIRALRHTKHGVKVLEQQLGQSPALFVQLLTMLYKRKDGGEDPPELRPSNQERATDLAGAVYTVLQSIKQTPGTDPETGKVDAEKLRTWWGRARELAREYSRESAFDSEVGQLLGRGPVGEDGIWPCEGVREALEDLGTPDTARGMVIGVHNSRGPMWRGDGGQQERELAAKYRKWSSQLRMQYPFTARILEDVASSYDRDAESWDAHSEIRHRLEH
jgi:hypothetical protein